MSRLEKRGFLVAGLLMLTALATACSGGGDGPTPTPTDAPAPTATVQGSRATPTPTPTDPGRSDGGLATDAPIVSPIGQAPNGFLLYLDEDQGFAFHYPETWNLAPIPGGSGALVFILGTGGSPQVAVYLTIEDTDLPRDERIVLAVERFQSMIGQEGTVTYQGPVLELDSGHQALRAELRYRSAGIDTALRLYVVSDSLRTYVYTVQGPEQELGEVKDQLETLVTSFVVFEPAPFGVARVRSLTMPWSDPITLDPAMSRESRSHLIVAHLFSGLVRFDEALSIQLDLAQDVQVDDAGTTYTFTMRDGITFHDGRPITAEDVRYSLERAADPELRSATASLYLGDIVGVRDKLEGRADTIRGVEVADDRTIRITIDEPKAYFLAKLTYPTGAIVDRETVEPLGVEWWKRDANGSGPFKLREWDEGRVLVLERFEDYPEVSTLQYAVFPIQQGFSMQLYEADLTDVAFIGGANIDRALDPVNHLEDQLKVFPQFNSQFIGFNTQKPPFDDPLMRRAFAMAADRERLVEVVFGNDVEVAKGLLPPGLPGYNAALEPIPFDPEAARELLARSRYAGDAFPEVVYTTSGLGNISPDIQLLIDGWREHLSVEVIVRQLDPDAYFYQLYEQVDNLFDFGWIADYPDPENFLDVLLHSEAHDNNVGGYSNPEYDRLLESARSEPDTAARMRLYNQAEQLLLDDTGIIPLYHGPDYVLTKPHVEGFAIGPLGIPLLQNVTIRPRSEAS